MSKKDIFNISELKKADSYCSKATTLPTQPSSRCSASIRARQCASSRQSTPITPRTARAAPSTTNEKSKDEKFFNNIGGKGLEKHYYDLLFSMGHEVIVLNEKKSKQGNNLAAVDMALNGVLMDIGYKIILYKLIIADASFKMSAINTAAYIQIGKLPCLQNYIKLLNSPNNEQKK